MNVLITTKSGNKYKLSTINEIKIKYPDSRASSPDNKFAKTKIIKISAKTVIFDKITDKNNLSFFFVTFVNFEIKITSLVIFLNFFISY